MKTSLRLAVYGLILFHMAFVAFAVLGGVLLLRYPALWPWHLPVLVWALLVEVMQWPCPLTACENTLRRKAGMPTYSAGFVEHYLLASLFRGSRRTQFEIMLSIAVFVMNISLYIGIFLF